MSKKQIKQLIVMMVALVVCVVGYFVVDNYSKAQKEKSEEESKKEAKANTTLIYEMESIDNITGFAYVVEGETLMFLKDTTGTWYYSGDSSVNIDESSIESAMLTNLIKIESEEVIESPEDTSPYGFDEPTNQIVVSMSDGTTKTFIIGAQNEFDTSKYYLMLEGDDNVYVIDSVIPNSFDMTVEELTVEETTVAETTAE